MDDYREILGLGDDLELSAVQSRYRQLMRLLHPDKRGAMTASAQASCDQAMERVQEALAGLKKDMQRKIINKI